MTRSAALLLLWIALWGEVSVANLVSGILVVAAAGWLFDHDERKRYSVLPLPAVRLVLHVLASLVGSSTRVAIAVLSPSERRVSTSVQTVRLRHGSVFVGAVVANAITLTPGTMTLDLDRESLTLTVHVLGVVDSSEFEQEVLRLEDLVAGAVKERSR